MVQLAKNLPAMRETPIRSLGWEDPLEKGRLPTPVFWPGKSHGQRSLAGYHPWGHKRIGHDLVTKWAFPIAQLVKNPPAMKETLVHFLGQEDLLEKG